MRVSPLGAAASERERQRNRATQFDVKKPMQQRQHQQQGGGVVVLHRPHLTPFSTAPPSAEELAHSAALEQVR